MVSRYLGVHIEIGGVPGYPWGPPLYRGSEGVCTGLKYRVDFGPILLVFWVCTVTWAIWGCWGTPWEGCIWGVIWGWYVHPRMWYLGYVTCHLG